MTGTLTKSLAIAGLFDILMRTIQQCLVTSSLVEVLITHICKKMRIITFFMKVNYQ